MRKFIGEKGIKLSKFLLSEYDGSLSFAKLNKLLRKKDIKVDDKRINKDFTLLGGENIVCYYDGGKTQYQVVYFDDNILVVNKPKGINSDVFYNQLKNEYKTLYFCHRLDRETDGVMIFAFNEQAYNEMFEGFKKRSFEKYYLVKVFGNIKNDCGVLTHYIIKDSKKAFVSVYDEHKQHSLKAQTEYCVVERKDNYTILTAKIITGRTHQIRAQFAHIGNFVLGDGKYGDIDKSRGVGFKELQLTSYKLILHFDKDNYLAYLDGKTFDFKG